MHEVYDQLGNIHYLTDDAVIALQAAKTGDKAEAAFERYASDVPRRSRGAVWQNIPTEDITKKYPEYKS